MKVAIFDLGSNTTKLLVAETAERGRPQVVAEESRPCRLTTGGGNKFSFSEETIDRLLAVLTELMKIARDHEVDRMKAVATEAFRKSENSQELIALAQASLGLPISVLTGLEEAGAIAAGLLSDPSIELFDDFHALDLGGGSMEVIAVKEREVTSVESLPLGAAVVSNRFCPDSVRPWSDQACLDAQKHVQSFLNGSHAAVLSTHCSTLVGAGGTLVFLRKILENESDRQRNGKGVLKLSDSINLFDRLSKMTLSQRVDSYPSLPPSRADIFPAGLLVLNEITSHYGRKEIIHSYRNLRHGIASGLAMES